MAGDDFLARAHRFFISKGYSSHAAAALAANAVAESGGNTRAVHDAGTGVGIYGFRDPKPGTGRKTALLNWAKQNNLDPYAENTQLAYAAHELDTTEKASGDALRRAKDYREATNATVGYLRPQGYSADNPTGAHNYAGRWNTGAALAGAEPMLGGAIAAAGGANEPPATGLLALDTSGLDRRRAEQAAANAGFAEKEREKEDPWASLQKTGMGLLQQEEQAQAPVAAPPPLPMRQPQADEAVTPYQFLTSMDDFQKLMMQQKLLRRS